jgi:hypothetical protein
VGKLLFIDCVVVFSFCLSSWRVKAVVYCLSCCCLFLELKQKEKTTTTQSINNRFHIRYSNKQQEKTTATQSINNSFPTRYSKKKKRQQQHNQ